MIKNENWQRQLTAFFETLLLTAILLGIEFWFQRSNPSLFKEALSWIWLAPILIALRYGFFMAIFAGLLAFAIEMCFINIQKLNFNDYQIGIFAGAILVLICSAFSDRWTKAKAHMVDKADYLDRRVETIAKGYAVLKLSHARLEQSLITKPVTLRGALTEVKKILTKEQGIVSPAVALQLLELLCGYVSLENGAIYLFLNENQISLEPLAQLGKKESLDLEDPLVKNCLDKKEISYYAVNQLKEKTGSKYLAIIPIINSNREYHGILSISDIPFMQLNAEVLRLIMVLMCYCADTIWATRNGKDILEKFPTCPAEFAAELNKAFNLSHDANLESAIVSLDFLTIPQTTNVIFELTKKQRGLDCLWQFQKNAHSILVILMPLSNLSAIDGYIARINKIIDRIYPENYKGLVNIRYAILSAYPNTSDLLSYVMNDV